MQGAEQACTVPPALPGSRRGASRAALPHSCADGATATCLPFFSAPEQKDVWETCYQIWAPPQMLTPNLPPSPMRLAGWASANEGLWLCPATTVDLLPEISWKYIQPSSELLDGTPQPLKKLKTILPQGTAQIPGLSIRSSPSWASASRDAQPQTVFLSHFLWMGHPRGASKSHRGITELVLGTWAGQCQADGRSRRQIGMWEQAEI